MSLRNKKPRKKDVTRWVDAIVRKHIYGSANTSRSAALFLFSRTLASSMVNTEEQAVAATKSGG